MKRMLDLFAGAGGATKGYQRCDFYVIGVDNKPQPNYCGNAFVQMDALQLLERLLAHKGVIASNGLTYFIEDFVAIHASPPCQRFSTATKRNGTQDAHPDLIGPTRELLEQTGLPYVIENVVGAPLAASYILCGSAFGLKTDGYRLKRHRAFEMSYLRTRAFDDPYKECYCHEFQSIPVMDVTGGGPTHKARTDGGGGRPYKGTADQARRIMGIDWMTKTELNEAIPPAYTEFIGRQLMGQLERAPA